MRMDDGAARKAAPSADTGETLAARLRVVHQRMLELGFQPAQSRTPQELAAGLRAESERVGAVLKEIGFKPE